MTTYVVFPHVARVAANASTGFHYAATVTTIVTAVLVVVTAVQVGLTRTAVQETAKAAQATQKSVDVSVRLAEEALRTRVDQRAPRVYIESSSEGHHKRDQSETEQIEPRPGGRQARLFTLPADDDQPLTCTVDFHLVNEGTSVAAVHLNDLVCKHPQFSVLSTSQNPGCNDSAFVGTENTLVPPGSKATARVHLTASVRSWIDFQPATVSFSLHSMDLYEEGVSDVVSVKTMLSNVLVANDATATEHYGESSEWSKTIRQYRFGPPTSDLGVSPTPASVSPADVPRRK